MKSGRIIWAFVSRNFKVERSYKFTFVFQLCSVFFSVILYFFINRLFEGRIPGALSSSGTNYFQYCLVGVAVNTWLFSLAYIGSGALGEEMRNGSLDLVLLGPASPLVIFTGLSAWRWIYETFIMVFYFIAGALFFQINFSQISWPFFLLSLGASFFCFAGINLLSTAFQLVFKRGNIAGWVMGSFMMVWGNVYFPVSLLPEKIQKLAILIPLDNILDAVRLSLFNPSAVAEIHRQILITAVWALFLVASGLWSFSAALKYARRHGTLSFI
jgi:ABC-2 type transport system permease protein